MSNFEPDNFTSAEIEHNLGKAIERIRNAHSQRQDVVVDLKNAKVRRLELLIHDLQDVIHSVPEEYDFFEFSLSSGEAPRFWIDLTSFVRMGADGREYEFVKDTRKGRMILGRSLNRVRIGDTITNYIAERILDRERAIEGDWVSASAVLDKPNILEYDAEPAKIADHTAQEPAKNIETTEHDLSELKSFLLWPLALVAIIAFILIVGFSRG